MPAKSKAQQRLFGMVHAVQKGDMKAPSKQVAEVARSIGKGDAKDFAETKQKGLPEKKEKEAMATIDISKLGALDLAYIEGFVKACADKGVDPEAVLAKLAEDDEEDEEKKPGTVKRVAGGAGRGALAGGAIGAGLGATGAALASARPLARMAKMPGSNKGEALATALKTMLGGAVGGGLGGAATGALTGGVMRAVT